MSDTAERFMGLVAIMARLRTPETGCPWDLEQDFSSIAPYTIEEAYEVADAIQRDDMVNLCEELGDLLLQVVFHAQIASETELFSLDDVIEAINLKMIRRHPHVFSQNGHACTAKEQTIAWEALKAEERAQKQASASQASALSGIALALPALLRAEKLQKRAAQVGFDWTDPADIFAKLEEETGEVKEALQRKDQSDIEEEIGDMLFVCANLARRLRVDPELALKKANRKFETRFRAMECLATEDGENFSDLSLQAQEVLWNKVKSQSG